MKQLVQLVSSTTIDNPPRPIGMFARFGNVGTDSFSSLQGDGYIVPEDGSIANLTFALQSAVSAGNSVTVLVDVNGTPSALSVTVSGGDYGTNFGTTIVVSKFDVITLSYTYTGSGFSTGLILIHATYYSPA